ncbi:FkbM family methyltransferase [Eisenibacter elegans]|uniref:FkbM family methyltransferase n=1 Tax=Eisenibacter elegans TaxID=997 RepID=UPI000425188B|nr:FkbM family methyltransferase [Eisenibacter elegans]
MGFLKNLLPTRIYRAVFDFYQDYVGITQKTYSQEGEDLILQKIFATKSKGFYVDVGAYHPKTFSNTYHFYKKGWQGINIDPNPNSIRKFRRFRKRDININMGIASTNTPLTYYMFAASALNTFSEKVYLERLAQKASQFLGTQTIPTIGLAQLLEKHLPQHQPIDFMSIDVEGLEMQVIQTNDWQVYRPKVVLIEEYTKNLTSLDDSEVFRFFSANGYHFLAKTYNTFVFIDAALAPQ